MKNILFTILILFTASISLAQQDTTRTSGNETIRLPAPKESKNVPNDDVDGDGEITQDEIKTAKLLRLNNCARNLVSLTDMRLGYEESTPIQVEIQTINFNDYNCAAILGRTLEEYLPK
jgi:hypothetical protein